MSNTYNDSAMMIASQIAYLEFRDGETNVGETVDGILQMYGNYEDGQWELKPEYKNNTSIKDEFVTAKTILQITESSGGSEEWRNWNVVDVCNDQNDTGYYGLLIDTGGGNAIIGSRGSESTDLSTGYKDWGEADLGLLDNELTWQQEKAEAYMQKLWLKYGDEYESFYLTGHSLGGNLATHMTITAPDEMRGKIEHCISMDGPGFSEEYIEAHKEEIEKVADKIDHYQWSWVSGLLNPLPGVDDKIIKAHDDESVGNKVKAMFWRHATYNVEYDENGNVMKGDESDLSAILGPISRYIENSSMEQLIIQAFLEERYVPLPNIFELIIGLKLIAKVVHEFKTLGKQIDNLRKQIYYNYIAPNVSGDYEVQMMRVSNMAVAVSAAERRLQTISDEINDIRKNLKYWSATGAYYRSALATHRIGLENDLKKLKKMAEIADKAVLKYGNTDTRVQSSFVF